MRYMVPAITMIQAYKCFKYDIVRPIDILVQRETISVGEKINIVWPDFFSVDSIQNIWMENWTKAIHGYINMYCRLPTWLINDGLHNSSTKQQDKGLVALALLFHLTNNLVLEAALTNLWPGICLDCSPLLSLDLDCSSTTMGTVPPAVLMVFCWNILKSEHELLLRCLRVGTWRNHLRMRLIDIDWDTYYQSHPHLVAAA